MAKRTPKEAKRQNKTDVLVARTASILGVSLNEARRLLSQPLIQSVRINPLRGAPNETLEAMRKLGWKGKKVAWVDEGYTIAEGFEALRDSPLISEGKIYIQNASSWLPIALLSPQPSETILDVCAAPGGKTSHIAARMQNTGRLVANDNSRSRLMKLQSNMERLGAVADYTLYDATNLSRALDGGLFDRILLDAPCSGEGLINLVTPKTLDTWSVAHIRRLATLQRRLITEAWKLLKPGGVLVYSTCTMAPEEDEALIGWFLSKNVDASILPVSLSIGKRLPVMAWNDRDLDARVQDTVRIAPGGGNEAFFACALEKQTDASSV